MPQSIKPFARLYVSATRTKQLFSLLKRHTRVCVQNIMLTRPEAGSLALSHMEQVVPTKFSQRHVNSVINRAVIRVTSTTFPRYDLS